MTALTEILLADLTRQLAELHERLHDDMRRLPERKKQERWDRFHNEIRPIQRTRDHLIRDLANLHAYSPIIHELGADLTIRPTCPCKT